MKEIKQLQKRIDLQKELVSIYEAKVLNREALLKSANDLLTGEQTILERLENQLAILQANHTLNQVNNN